MIGRKGVMVSIVMMVVSINNRSVSAVIASPTLARKYEIVSREKQEDQEAFCCLFRLIAEHETLRGPQSTYVFLFCVLSALFF